MNLSMLHIGLYQRPETNLQTTHSVFLGLYLSGLNYERFRGTSGGQLISEVEDVKVPALTLIPPNVRIEFQCGQKRENWVIQCSLPELHYEAGNSFTVLHDHGHSFRLPFRTPLTVEKAHRLREKFKMIQENYQTGLPENIFCAETVASTLLADIILAQEKEKIVTAAEKFKNMIDRDACFRKTLAELSREAQCSAGHISKLFVKQYLIEPGEYRARLRLRRIMHYIEQTDLSLKEIADQVGMKHVTHLHLFLRERCGTTPRMLLKQYRGE